LISIGFAGAGDILVLRSSSPTTATFFETIIGSTSANAPVFTEIVVLGKIAAFTLVDAAAASPEVSSNTKLDAVVVVPVSAIMVVSIC
jgi:hypothetical protein